MKQEAQLLLWLIAHRTAYDILRYRLSGKLSNLIDKRHYSVTDRTSPSQWITERNTTSVRLIVCLKELTFQFSSARFFGAFCG